MEEDGLRIAYAPAFFRRLGQHFLREVGADHLIAPQSQKPGQAAGAAGQIQNGMDGQPAAGEMPLHIVCPSLIIDIFRELVIALG